MSELAAWDSFYVIVGSAAGALIGLQFVVLTLIVTRSSILAADAGSNDIPTRVRGLVVSSLLPLTAYALLVLSAFAAPSRMREQQHLLVLFNGIHNETGPRGTS